MKQYPLILAILMGTVLLPVTVIILILGALRGRRERKQREALQRGYGSQILAQGRSIESSPPKVRNFIRPRLGTS